MTRIHIFTVRNTFLRKLYIISLQITTNSCPFQPWNAEKLNCLSIIFQIRGLTHVMIVAR